MSLLSATTTLLITQEQRCSAPAVEGKQDAVGLLKIDCVQVFSSWGRVVPAISLFAAAAKFLPW